MSNFLVPDATFVIELAAFTLVLFVVARFVLPRLHTAVEARQDEIRRGLAQAAEAERLEQAADAEAQGVLRAARHEAAETIEQARVMRDEMIAQGLRDGRAEYEWLAGRADREMARRETQLRRQFELRATKAAVAAVGQAVGAAGVARLTVAIAAAMEAPAQPPAVKAEIALRPTRAIAAKPLLVAGGLHGFADRS
jgi:F-type H+-transporting ATPase subunit b